MARTIFVNLPVVDVARSTEFYAAWGFSRNEAFSNERGAAMVWSDAINVMLLAHDLYAGFTPKRIIDAHAESGALLCLSCDTRDEVDQRSAAALAAGGRELHGAEDEGFMYSRAFEDPDGHGWQVMWMDVPAATEAIASDREQD